MVSRGLVILLSLVVVASQTGGVPEFRRSPVAAEIDSPGPHPWVGIYEHRLDSIPELGPLVRLELSPRGSYVLERRVGCFLTPVITDGVVIADDGRIRLQPRLPAEPQFPTVGHDPDPLAGGLLTLALGGRRYLIPASQVTNFCNAVNSGYGLSMGGGLFLLREGEESPEAPREELPLEVSRCLLEKPLRTRIVSVGDVEGHGPGQSLPGSTRRLQTGWGALPVVLDVGANDGVWAGMEFYSACPACSYQPAKVTSVGERTSEAVFRAEWLAGTPEPGWLMSTRAGDPLD